MDKIVINGGNKLNGTIRVNGSKNSILPMIAASLLTNEKVVIRNAPPLKDIQTMLEIMRDLGAQIDYDQDARVISLEVTDEENKTASYELVRKMRASVCVLGPLVAKRGFARVSLPGGCVIGPRPIDIHLKGLEALGCEISVKHGYVNARSNGLKGRAVDLSGPFGSSVLATANVMMASVISQGRTIIRNAAREPEIVDLANFLNSMGASIEGHGNAQVTIEGVKELGGADYEVIPDRIEAGTFLIGAVIAQGEMTIENFFSEHNSALLDVLDRTGVMPQVLGPDKISVSGNGKIEAIDVIAEPYPGLPTDLQAQLTVMLCLANGTSTITEKVYPERFMHVGELNRMGSMIDVKNGKAVIKGVDHLSGTNVMASDLRASAALVLAGLVAEGRTEISRVYHIDRGYERIEERLRGLGADIYRTTV